MYNTTFAALPILVYAVLEQNFDARHLLDNFYLYRAISGNARMSWLQFLKWNLLGLWHALVIYASAHLLFYFEFDMIYDGKPLDMASMGTIVCKGVVWVVNLKVKIKDTCILNND